MKRRGLLVLIVIINILRSKRCSEVDDCFVCEAEKTVLRCGSPTASSIINKAMYCPAVRSDNGGEVIERVCSTTIYKRKCIGEGKVNL